MATRNIVPRGDGEGSLGTSIKRWLSAFFNWINIKNYILFTPSSSETHQEGKVFYDSNEHTLSIFNEDSQVTHQLGQEELIRVYNDTGSTINDGKVVKIIGMHSSAPKIALAKADTIDNARSLGVTTGDIPNLSHGYVTIIGKVNNIDTSGFTSGDRLFLSDSIAGELTNTVPSIQSFIGYALTIDTNSGSIFVNNTTPFQNTGDMLKSVYDTNDNGEVDKCFSQDHEYAESNAESSTTSTTLQDKVSLTFTPPSTGDYILEWYAEVIQSTGSQKLRINIDLDTGTSISDAEYSFNNTHPDYRSISGFKKINLDNTSHTIKIQFAIISSGTAYIKNARLLARRVH